MEEIENRIDYLTKQLDSRKRELKKLLYIKEYLKDRDYEKSEYADPTKFIRISTNKYMHLVDWSLDLSLEREQNELYEINVFDHEVHSFNSDLLEPKVVHQEKGVGIFHKLMTLSGLYDAIKMKLGRNVIITGITNLYLNRCPWRGTTYNQWKSLRICGIFPSHDKVQTFLDKDSLYSKVQSLTFNMAQKPKIIPGGKNDPNIQVVLVRSDGVAHLGFKLD